MHMRRPAPPNGTQTPRIIATTSTRKIPAVAMPADPYPTVVGGEDRYSIIIEGMTCGERDTRTNLTSSG